MNCKRKSPSLSWRRMGICFTWQKGVNIQVKMGRVRFEPTTNALKGHCSTAELPTQIVYCSTTSSILSKDSGICNFTNLNKKYGKIVNIDTPISVAKNIILLTFQIWFNFLQLYDTINWHNNKCDKWHYIKNNFHVTPLSKPKGKRLCVA